MTQDDELRRLRRDLDALFEQAGGMRHRLEGLERQARIEALAETTHEIPKSVVPPPLPPLETPVKPVAPPAASAVRMAPVTPTAKPVHPPQPDRIKTLAAKIPSAERTQSAIQRRIAEEGWEAFVFSYLFPRIGIVLLTVAVVFLLVLAATYSTPIMRVGAGYLVCAGLLGLGRWLEGKYRAYARVLYSGGFALSYFVTFAAHYIPQARVIDSTPFGLALLAAVVAIWAFMAQVRRSRLIATLVTVLGHLTIALAIFESGDIARYSVAGVIVLSAGSAFFLLRNRWYYVGMLGLAGSYLNHAFWAYTVQSGNTVFDFCASTSILTGYFLIFALAELFAPEDLRREKIPLWFRNAYVTMNSVCFLVLGSLTVDHFDFSRGHQDWFRLIYAAVLFLMALAYLRLRERDPLYNIYMTKAVAMLTLGIATIYEYEGTKLTAFLAVETLALLYSARRSGLLVTRVLAFAVAALTLFQGCASAVDEGLIAYANPDYAGHVIPAILAVLAFFAASQLYQRTDWVTRTPHWPSLNTDTQLLLWQLDLLREPPASHRHMQKPAEGLLFPYTYALAGIGMALVYTFYLVEGGHRFAVIGALAFALTILAAILRAKPFGVTALVAVSASLAVGTAEIALDDSTPYWLAALGVVALGLAAVRSDRRLFGDQIGLAFHQLPAAPYFLYGAMAWTLGLLLNVAIDGYLPSALALAAAACAAAGLILLLHPGALACVAVGLHIWAALTWYSATGDPHTVLWQATAWGLAMLALTGDRYFAVQRPLLKTSVFGHILIVVSWALMSRYAWMYAAEDWRMFFECAVAFAFLGYAFGVRSLAGGAVAVGGAAFASLGIVYAAYNSTLPNAPLIASFVACAAFWVVGERLVESAKPKQLADQGRSVSGVCAGAAAVLLVLMLHRIPQLATYFLTISWTVLAFALFGVSLALKQSHYRHAGLGIFILAIVRAGIYDTQNLGGFYRVAAIGFLGAVLLVVGFGYWKAIQLAESQRKADARPREHVTQKIEGEQPKE